MPVFCASRKYLVVHQISENTTVLSPPMYKTATIEHNLTVKSQKKRKKLSYFVFKSGDSLKKKTGFLQTYSCNILSTQSPFVDDGACYVSPQL